MKLLKFDLQTFTAAIALGALSVGFAPAASAISTYDALAEFTLTLTSVTDVTGAPVADGWDVTALGKDFGGADLTEIGDATATGSVSVVSPSVSLGIEDSIIQSSTSSGTAIDGTAATDALTDLDISVDNFSGQALTFSFDWSVVLEASATGDALANASVDFLDDLGYVDILEIVTDKSQDINTGGSFMFTLLNAESNPIAGFVDTFGEATAVIPVPAAVWLFGSGLLGLVGVARRRQAS
jgi:hypothetical protein